MGNRSVEELVNRIIEDWRTEMGVRNACTCPDCTTAKSKAARGVKPTLADVIGGAGTLEDNAHINRFRKLCAGFTATTDSINATSNADVVRLNPLNVPHEQWESMKSSRDRMTIAGGMATELAFAQALLALMIDAAKQTAAKLAQHARGVDYYIKKEVNAMLADGSLKGDGPWQFSAFFGIFNVVRDHHAENALRIDYNAKVIEPIKLS